MATELTTKDDTVEFLIKRKITITSEDFAEIEKAACEEECFENFDDQVHEEEKTVDSLSSDDEAPETSSPVAPTSSKVVAFVDNQSASWTLQWYECFLHRESKVRDERLRVMDEVTLSVETWKQLEAVKHQMTEYNIMNEQYHKIREENEAMEKVVTSMEKLHNKLKSQFGKREEHLRAVQSMALNMDDRRKDLKQRIIYQRKKDERRKRHREELEVLRKLHNVEIEVKKKDESSKTKKKELITSEDELTGPFAHLKNRNVLRNLIKNLQNENDEDEFDFCYDNITRATSASSSQFSIDSFECLEKRGSLLARNSKDVGFFKSLLNTLGEEQHDTDAPIDDNCSNTSSTMAVTQDIS